MDIIVVVKVPNNIYGRNECGELIIERKEGTYYLQSATRTFIHFFR